MRNLSKSKIIAFRQCPKRLWLEIHQPELCDNSASEMVFQIGHEVGEMARDIHDPHHTGTTISIAELGHSGALARSADLLVEGKAPIFEAGVASNGAIAYADVMLPDHTDGTLRWKMIEVKSSTSVKDYYREDIAIQSYIATSAGVRLSSVSIAHVDSSFVYQGNGDYRGLFKENDLTEEALGRNGEVQEWIADAHAVAALKAEPQTPTGLHCTKPFNCGFSNYCNRTKVRAQYPISTLPKLSKPQRTQFEAMGSDDLRDIDDHLLSPIQQRVKKCAASGESYFDAEGAAADLAPHGFPAYFLDFETVAPAVPRWKDTSPYQKIPFQFSLHVLEENGTFRHHGFLDLSGNDPSRACAQSLMDLCGVGGPVFAYNASFECSVMSKLASRFPEFATALESIISRVVDLLPIAREHYYHPSQHGSWSIKHVLPAAVPELSYDQLDGIQNGSLAIAAYMKAIHPETTTDKKQQLEEQLNAYCKLDTWAMVRLWQFFTGAHLP